MSDNAPIPNIIRAAGESAMGAYRQFVADPKWSPSTRDLYRSRAARFFRWADARGLTLQSIDTPALAAYAAEIAATKSPHEATVYLTPVRGALGHLARSGVLATDPCPKGQRNGRTNEYAINSASPPSIPLAELKRTVLEIGEEDGWEEGDEDVQAGLVLLAPLSIKTMDPEAVSRFTGVAEPLVREFAVRLIENGIWMPDGTIALSGNDNLALMLDVWTATGMLVRRTEPENDAASPSDAVKGS
jgi:hypothetical protein